MHLLEKLLSRWSETEVSDHELSVLGKLRITQQDNRIFYLTFFRAGDRSYISRPLMECYLEEYADTSRHESIQYQMDFFAAGLRAVAFRWLKSGCVQSPNEMAMLVSEIA